MPYSLPQNKIREKGLKVKSNGIEYHNFKRKEKKRKEDQARPSITSKMPPMTKRGCTSPTRPCRSTGRGSISPNPCRSMESPSHRDRSSLSAISMAEGRRRTTIIDERPRRTAQGSTLTPVVLWAALWSGMSEVGCGCEVWTGDFSSE
jgi:hypothetical protein